MFRQTNASHAPLAQRTVVMMMHLVPILYAQRLFVRLVRGCRITPAIIALLEVKMWLEVMMPLERTPCATLSNAAWTIMCSPIAATLAPQVKRGRLVTTLLRGTQHAMSRCASQTRKL
jgi:hypothetical protein